MEKKIKFLIACLLGIQFVAAQEDSLAIQKTKTKIEYGRGIIVNPQESTAAVSSADEKALSHKKSINASNMLFGLIPGLQVLQNAGNAWNDNATLYVRGLGTLNSQNPLILVDGFERDINQLTSDEIESVSVLKDAVGAALYGMKGGNGVILIKTRRGAEGAPQVNFSYQFNVATPNRLPEFVDGYTYANALNEGLTNDEQAPRYNSAELNAFKTQSNPLFYPNVNWMNEALRGQSNGDNVTLSVKGGGKFVRYFTQINYLDDRGVLKPTEVNNGYSTQFKYSKLNLRSNLDIEATPTTHLQLNLLGSFSEENSPAKSTSEIFSALYKVPSGAFPIRTRGNIYGGTSIYSNNPVGLIASSGYGRMQTRNMFADLSIKQDLDVFLKGLYTKVRVGMDNKASYWDANSMDFGYESAVINLQTGEEKFINLRNEGGLSFGSSINTATNHFNLEGSLNFDRSWDNDNHVLNAQLLYAMDKTSLKGVNTSKAFMDVVAQAHYAYKGRYAVDASLSGSASSYLEPGNRWGIFPAVGASWLLSDESFMNQDWLNLLKVRASYGISGRTDFAVDLFEEMYGGGKGYYFKDNPASINGIRLTRLGMQGLTYEKSHKLNVGVDFLAFNRLSLTVDAFYDHRTDILISGYNAVSGIFGMSVPQINNGIVNNRGMEASLRWNDRVENFTYVLGAQFSFNRNEIINQNEQYRPYDYLKRTGKSIGQIFGYEVEGIYKDQAEIDNRPVKQYLSTVHPGDLKFKDQNGDYRIDEYDQVALGYNTMCPEINYSVDLSAEYKGLGVYALFQGTGNYSQVLNTPGVWKPLVDNGTISTEYYNNRWTSENLSAKYPRLTSNGSDNNYNTNSVWVADASFLKLRTLEISYKFNSRTLKNIPALKDVKLFARAHDLFCLDNIKIADPESIGATHPTMKQYVLGFNLSF